VTQLQRKEKIEEERRVSSGFKQNKEKRREVSKVQTQNYEEQKI
jgi:hypothetical protein